MDRILALNSWKKTDWFQYFDLLCAVVAAFIWSVLPLAAWWPILIAIIPWFLRISARKFPFRRTKFDGLIVVFVTTAGLGVWSSYDPDAAWQKFWVLIGAIFIYYALARQPKRHIAFIFASLAILGGVIAAFFLLSNDWNSKPADFSFINRISTWWLNSVPKIANWDFDPNKTAGSIVYLLPFALASLGYLRQHQNEYRNYWLIQSLIFIVTGVMLFGLLMSSARGAWVALVIASTVWFLWRRYYGFDAISKQTIRFYLVLVLLVILILVSVALNYFGNNLFLWIDSLPGYASGYSRFELAENTIHLIADYPIIGGGLEAFAGQYSQYILVVPHVYFTDAHNIFFDIAFEQGLIGLTAFVLVTVGSAFILLRNPVPPRSRDDFPLFGQAVVVSILVMVLHGIFDDALYQRQGTFLLFVPAGLAVALSHNQTSGSLTSNTLKSWSLYWKIAITLVFIGGILLVSRPVKSVLSANLGAIKMAKIQLVDFPTGRWDEHFSTTKFNPAENFFKASLASNSSNTTANYRMGLIAMQMQEYPSAVEYLEKAYRNNVDHRGIQKNLGYCYVWVDDYDRAEYLLVHIPEAERELDVYSWWWGTLGEEVLAEHARIMSARLAD